MTIPTLPIAAINDKYINNNSYCDYNVDAYKDYFSNSGDADDYDDDDDDDGDDYNNWRQQGSCIPLPALVCCRPAL